jgi:hypothetical protein
VRESLWSPKEHSHSIVYTASRLEPLWKLRLSLGYSSIGSLLALPVGHHISDNFWQWIASDPHPEKYECVRTSFALERDALLHLHQEIAEHTDLRADHQLDLYAFSSLGFSSRTVGVWYDGCVNPGAIQVWIDGAYHAADLNGGAAVLNWEHGYTPPPKLKSSPLRR